MELHPAVRQSFFIRFLLTTAFLGNSYICLQALVHSFNYHGLDLYLRWYPFQANQFWNILLVTGTFCTLYGLKKITQGGLKKINPYFIGKCITCIAYVILIWLEYKISRLPFPSILLPVIITTQAIYPMLLYISLRKRPRPA